MALSSSQAATTSSAGGNAVAFNSPYVPVAEARDTRQVFAHFMIGNTFGQGYDWFVQEINLAKSMGIDGFALNVGYEEWQPARVATMYQAAEATGFKVFVSLDFATLYGFTPEALADTFVAPFANSPAQYKMGGRSYLTTFMGESYRSGQRTETARLWLYFKNYLLSKNVGIFFVPVFTGLGATVNGWDALDGAMTWEMWTKTLDALNYYMALRDNPSPQSDIKKGTLPDDPLSIYNGKVHMAGVSPIFFTHYNSKNFIFRDDFLYNARWAAITAAKVDMVQLVSWNDYGESHYIGSLDPQIGDYYTEGSSSARDWSLTPGLAHTDLAPITKYFISTYKNGGTAPALTTNTLFFSHRLHSMTAVATGDSLGAPSCGQYGAPAEGCQTADNIYFTVLSATSEPWSFTVTSGAKTFTFTVAQLGESRFTFPGFSQGTPAVSLPNGQTITGGNINNNIIKYNYNHFMRSVQFGI
jgi:glucan endo-1,3-alpha-glucosidase